MNGLTYLCQIVPDTNSNVRPITRQDVTIHTLLLIETIIVDTVATTNTHDPQLFCWQELERYRRECERRARDLARQRGQTVARTPKPVS